MFEIKKPKSFRSEKYLNFVRSKPCCVCMMPAPNHAHHLIGVGNGIMGSKECDGLTIPLCHTHHSEVHHDINKHDQLQLFVNFIRNAFNNNEILLSVK
jgi:hypothetical protein